MSSLEAKLEDERKQSLALLENTRANSGRSRSPHPGGRALSPATTTMADVGGKHRADWSHLGKTKRNSRGSAPSSPAPSPRSPRGSMMPNMDTYALPASGTKPKPRAMSSVFGDQSGKLNSNKERDRHGSFGGFQSQKSSSPGPRRSESPAIRSSGSITNLPIRKGSAASKSESPGGGVRLATDDYGDDEAAVESSDNDDTDDSDGENWGRGRQRSRSRDKGKGKALSSPPPETEDGLEPNVTVTDPEGATLSGEKMSNNKKAGVHPFTSFDQGGSAVSTPYNSDTEADLSELKSAQLLSMGISPIQSSPEAQRCVRQIVRGNYATFFDDAEKGLRRQRVYLVATDLSEEAAYALEWTIGTVLRDGDTLLAVYAVDEEIGVGGADTPGGPAGIAPTARDESDLLKKTLSNHQGLAAEGSGPSPLSNSVSATEADVNSMGKTEKDRYQAAVEVSNRCVKLLRKTRLQVRVVIEVFHCKSPKHMLTEVIDFLDPTLVILGSRGRSALKGVLLGSFSNYLVTKSSVPVMVARKRLRKHSKYKRKNLRLSNVISPSSGRLANAKID